MPADFEALSFTQNYKDLFFPLSGAFLTPIFFVRRKVGGTQSLPGTEIGVILGLLDHETSE